MRYLHTARATFLSRPNRFVAHVLLDGQEVVCHVKNTGRCRELLLPGVPVILSAADRPGRKTAWDLVAVYKDGQHLINMDSQAPNAAAAEFLPRLYPSALVRPEQRYGASRFDFLLERPEGNVLVEVKGCTLERSGHALFPDAPTLRGARHLRELAEAAESGLEAVLLVLVQMKGVSDFSPNDETDPAFGAALREAAGRGVKLLCYDCLVSEHGMTVDRAVPIHL